MTWFAIIAIALTGAAVLFLVLPLLRPGRGAQASPREANALVYRDQFRELERDLETGTLTSEQYTHARAELERRLLDDVESGAQGATRRVGFRSANGFGSGRGVTSLCRAVVSLSRQPASSDGT